jgi:branched-chain amino acid transport system permease protein
LRARLSAIVLSLLFAAFAALASASAVSASTPAQPGAATPVGAQTALAAGVPFAAADGDAGEAVTGTVKGPVGEGGANAPIAGVVITVNQNGASVGTATTDDQGKWTIPVPSPGDYEVTIDTSSLPDTVQLRNPDGSTIPGIKVQPNSTKVAVFPLVAAGEGAGTPSGVGHAGQLEYVLSVLVAGLRFGLIIAMTAIGLSLVFGTTGLINFAHGEFVAIGAVVAFLFGTSPLRWPFVAAVVIAIVAVGILSGLIELGLWRPLRKRGTGLIQMFIISIGVSLLLRHAVLLFFGSKRQQYAQATTEQQLDLGLIQVQPRDLVIIAVSIVVLLAVAFMLQRTRMGKAMRALADNKDLAEASGIDVQRVILQVWVLGGGLAALGGVFYGLTAAVYWDMGFNLLLLMFAGIILGGLGSAYGAILGSLVIGIVAQGSTIWFPTELQNAWALLVLIVVLLVRPQGILGRLQRAG